MTRDDRPTLACRGLAMCVSGVVVGLLATLLPLDPAILSAAATDAEAPVQAAEGVPARGGTLRVVVPRETQEPFGGFDEGADAFLDPQLDPSRTTHGLTRCCLGRTLYSYNGRRTEEGGSHLQPDLAQGPPVVSPDGLTWTIAIKPGLHYGPPLADVEITAADFVRSLERLFAPQLRDVVYTFEFMDIEGAADYQAGTAATISGLETPDEHTLVVRLAAPQGDFAERLAALATVPLPPDPWHPDAQFGIAEGADSGYGRSLVSSGPYMLDGSASLDLSRPAAERADPAGIAPGKVTLVRNPSWDPATDALRPAYADRIEISVVDTMDDAVAAIDAGRADLLWNPRTPPTIPAEVYEAFRSDPTRGAARIDRVAVVRAIVMNLAVPPFDDIHVRKALNWVLDKERLVDLQGGRSAAQPVGHIAPDALEDDLLVDYDPYATPRQRGDLAAARTEMARSRYDADGDGLCDSAVCQHVRMVTREPFDAAARSAAEDFAALGIDLDIVVHDINTFFFDDVADPRLKVPIVIGIAWHGLNLGASGVLLIFDGARNVTSDPVAAANVTMMGATPNELRSWGYDVVDVPNVDARVEDCVPRMGADQLRCWASLDQYLMERVVPWVPYSQDRNAALTSPRVVAYGYDELTNTSSLDQIALRE